MITNCINYPRIYCISSYRIKPTILIEVKNMKKGFLAYIFILSIILFSACAPIPSGPKIYEDYISTMHTTVRVRLYVESEDEFVEYFDEIKAIYDIYDTLTDNFKSANSEDVLSLYDINLLVNS